MVFWLSARMSVRAKSLHVLLLIVLFVVDIINLVALALTVLRHSVRGILIFLKLTVKRERVIPFQ